MKIRFSESLLGGARQRLRLTSRASYGTANPGPWGPTTRLGGMLEPIAFARGVHLRGTPLWFDAQKPSELSVITSLVDKLPPPHRRALAPPVTAEALRRAGYRGGLLPTPCDRWVGIGRQRLRLFSTPGSELAAMALSEYGSKRLLFAGWLRAQDRCPRADHLIAWTPALAHKGLAIDEAVAQAAAVAEAAQARVDRVTIWAEGLELAWEVVARIAGLGLPVRPSGILARLRPRSRHGRRGGVRVGLPQERPRPQERVIYLDAGLGGAAPVVSPGWQPHERIPVQWYATGADLGRMAVEAGVHTISLVGSGTSPTSGLALPPGVELQRLGRLRQQALPT